MESKEEKVETTPQGAEAEAQEGPEEIIGRLKRELEEARAQAQENYDKFVRLYAEFDNYRKRVAREKAELIRYGNEELLRELLPVVDNLERALEHAKRDPSNPQAILEGVELILEQVKGLLKRFGVEPIAAIGERFDPLRHEAVGEEEREDVEPGEVVQEVLKGYMLNDRLLRPAKVIVAKAKPRDAGEGTSD